jgi:hypothetical protein
MMKRMRTTLFLVAATMVLSLGWRTATPRVAGRVDFGKIYLTDTHLFVSELFKGINIYDITDVHNIHSAGYLTIDGNSDMVISGHTLYADCYEDLLIFDLSDPAHPALKDSVPNIFKVSWSARQQYVEDPSYESYGGTSGCSGQGCGNQQTTQPVYMDGGIRTNTGGGGQTGKSGSTARFVVVGTLLYCIDSQDMIVLDISTPEKPSLVGRVNIGFGIETLFFYKDYFFVGSNTGMLIYDNRDVMLPAKVGEFRHVRACDPVVVEGNRAYVTLRSGARCGQVDPAMHIVDISNVTDSKLLSSYRMDGPIGLTVVDGVAFVCDQNAVRILDVKDDAKVTELQHIDIQNTYDVIYDKGLLFVVGPMGIYIYDVHDVRNPIPVSTILNIS